MLFPVQLRMHSSIGRERERISICIRIRRRGRTKASEQLKRWVPSSFLLHWACNNKIEWKPTKVPNQTNLGPFDLRIHLAVCDAENAPLQLLPLMRQSNVLRFPLGAHYAKICKFLTCDTKRRQGTELENIIRAWTMRNRDSFFDWP